MRRNTALFGASLVAGVAAASGLIMTGGPSSAAPGDSFYGVAWADATSGQSAAWTTGGYADPYGFEFSGAATAGSGTFRLQGDTPISVTTTCVSGRPRVLVVGGGAAGAHTGGSVSMAKFTGDAKAIGSVTFATTKVAGHTAGAYINLSTAFGPGTYVALAGADCAAVATSTTTPPTSTTTNPPSSTTTPPTSTTTNPPTSTTTNPPTSTMTSPPTSTTTSPPTSTTTNPPTSTTTNPPSSTTTPPATTEPPTPTPATTTLPVTG